MYLNVIIRKLKAQLIIVLHEFNLKAVISQSILSLIHYVCMCIPQNIVAAESMLDNKMQLVFMHVNVKEEKIIILFMSNPSQDTTKEVPPLGSGHYPLPMMNNFTKYSNSTSNKHYDPQKMME